MSGEHSVARQLLAEALAEAESSPSMCPDTQALAILTAVLQTLSQTRSRKDVESFVAYNLENLVESDRVITRGC